LELLQLCPAAIGATEVLRTPLNCMNAEISIQRFCPALQSLCVELGW